MPSPDRQPPSAKRLILSLLSAPSLREVTLALLVKWGELFGLDAPTIRVTVGRLTRQGLLASPARGVYRIGPKGKLMAATASGWVNAEQRVGDWQGAWLLAHTSHLGRTNRSALRARERAFRLNGFAEYLSGLWLRPDNLVEPTDTTRERLLGLGLEPEALVVSCAQLHGIAEAALYTLWPRREIETAYRWHRETMQHSMARLGSMPLAEAASETMQVGEAVIRQINADPLLPAAMIDSDSRRTMIEQMTQYNRIGRDIWRGYIAQCDE